MRVVFLVGSVALAAAPVLAHQQLRTPQARYSDQKGGPCGRGGGEDGRTDRVTAFAPGQTIDVVWDETINHTGFFRVSFDDDGADAVDFDKPENILLLEEDPSNQSGVYERQVTLPDVTCGNCTLQVVQIMTSRETPSEGDTYFQCADLVLGDAASAPAEVPGGCAATPGAPLALLLLGLLRRRR